MDAANYTHTSDTSTSKMLSANSHIAIVVTLTKYARRIIDAWRTINVNVQGPLKKCAATGRNNVETIGTLNKIGRTTVLLNPK